MNGAVVLYKNCTTQAKQTSEPKISLDQNENAMKTITAVNQS